MKSALITDFYELTMAEGYFLKGHNPRVVFDMFYRTNPFKGGYILFLGLEDLLQKLEEFLEKEIYKIPIDPKFGEVPAYEPSKYRTVIKKQGRTLRRPKRKQA